MSLKKQTVRGIKWQIAVSMLHKMITFGTTIVLARKLGPSVYGLFAFSLVVVSSFELFKSMGVDAALLRRKDDFKKAADTAFVIIPLLGILLYVLLSLSAPYLGELLNNRDIVGVVRVLGIMFVLTCFTKVPVISLERNMRFKGISVAEICGTVVFSLTAIVLVFNGAGIWTLVFAYIARTLTYMVIVWVFSGWKPAFDFDVRLAQEMFGFGKFVFMTSVIWFLKANLDNILVGKLLGATMLGYYAVAFNIANFGADYFGGRIYRVIYPAYARLQSDIAGMRRAFLKVLKYAALIALPLGVGTFFIGGEFVSLTYGEKWISAVPVLKVLSWLAVSNMLLVTTDCIFMAVGKPNISFWTIVIQVVMFFTLVAPAAKLYGLKGVAAVVLAASYLSLGLQFFLVMKYLSLGVKDIFASLYPALVSSVLMVFALTAAAHASPLAAKSHGRYVFVIELLFAAVVYAGTLFVTNRPVFREMKEMVFS